jgi:hypothetical protein
LSGIRFFSSEITTFEHTSTNIVANPMDIPLIADVVVANVGHIPNTSANVGFSLNMPFSNVFDELFIAILLFG